MQDRQNSHLDLRLETPLEEAFFPEPKLVTPDYWAYARWRFLQRVASSVITVLATQQMLFAVGLGAKRALPTAAALNWVLKDGLGRIGKLTVATNFGRRFDADLKRFRFTSSVVYDLSAAVEICTPLFPGQFLLLATLANVGKSIGITTANVCRAPIQRSFALGENLADITARTSAQQVLADNLGLAIAVALTAAVRNMPRTRAVLPFALLPPLMFVDLYSIYRELKAVQLKTLNKERAELIAEAWVAERRVPSFSEVSKDERLLVPARLDEGSLPLDICPLATAAPTLADLRSALEHAGRAPGGHGNFLLTYHRQTQPKQARRWLQWASPARWLEGGQRRRSRIRGKAILAVHEDARAADILEALLQVAHLRALPFRRDLTPEEARRWALEESLARARLDRDEFLAATRATGWQTTNVLLSSAERATFTTEGSLADLAAAVSNLPGGGPPAGPS